ncbi:aldehyde dehydrogenase [Gordonia polyisoprenivorans VH2]|uniref:Aldehyde dehydrogenase n=1 Tax=Gordonia polyisoprenivorans (strain DSM 44266 / VH2) TaxID=1112204 RepID=H6MYM0_GORPV|nr:aldehyde dehydrogenase (NADP(+)) [Gordonia polyisoprenivorans]AFA71898.1 aldehyde dehydrogenase [Gordonia polyisoprenivorans VH2]WCB38276.1 aldehyde dehydrogenase (NADP(+)) [Gordonia polyisoprenivorans]
MNPVLTPTSTDITDSTPDQVEAAVAAAHGAATAWAATPAADRARALTQVADVLDAHGEELIDLAAEESHLPLGRLRGELVRTTFQLRYLGEYVAAGRHLDPIVDHADPDWPMGAPRPDLRRTHLPLGVVLNFAAGNFPFAFSVPGGDTASALAAGCPVVVKIHPGHPRLSVRIGDLMTSALHDAGAPDGVFGTIAGVDAGITALTDPRVRAATFTGSTRGGRALFDIASSRPDPIPFFGELGSVNPVFVTAAADRARGAEIAEQYVASFTLGMGQFCTSPGLLIVPDGSATLAALEQATLPDPAPMLTASMRAGFDRAVGEVTALDGVSTLATVDGDDDLTAAVQLHRTTAARVLDDPETLLQECFGPSSVIVTYADTAELTALADALPGQLTATVQGEDSDVGDDMQSLTGVLARTAGRLLWNQWPTGVSVTDAQHHGGPYPASTAIHTTSVGSKAIARFLRPITYQNFPAGLLPQELRPGAGADPESFR